MSHPETAAMPADTPKDGVRFDKTINLGHVLTIATFVLALMVQWSVMDKRVVVLEEFRVSQRERDAMQDNQAREKFQEVKDALNDLRRSVEKVADRVGVK